METLRREALRVAIDDRLAVVTIDRPDVRNSLSRGELRRLADRILAKGPLAVRLAKLVVRAGMDADQHTGQVIEQLAQALLCTTADKAEGATAFLEKRPPAFRGI